MSLYYRDNHVTLYNGSSHDMSEVADSSIQCVVTSPPYMGQRKYDGEQELIWGGDNHHEHEWGAFQPIAEGVKTRWTHNPTSKRDTQITGYGPATCQTCGAWKGGFGSEPTIEMYVEHTVEILREIRRVLRKDGVVFWNLGDSYGGSGRGLNADGKDGGSGAKQLTNKGSINTSSSKGIAKPKDLLLIPFRVAIAAQVDGWWVRSVIIWSKSNPMPQSVKDRPSVSHEYIIMLTKSAKYYYDSEAVREGANSAGATNGASLGSPTLAPKLGSALLADDTTPNLRGRCYLSESQITIIGSVTWNATHLKVLKAISLTIIGEQTEWQFVMDLKSSSDTASLALITSTLKSLSANNTPVRATIVNATSAPSGAIDTDSMLTVPSADTSPATEAVSQPVTVLTGIAEKGLPTLVTIHSEELESPLPILGTLRSTHISHDTINTNESQGRNLRSVWTINTQPYPGPHYAVFPEALPERCIKAATPEYGCCEKCGKPWERIIKKSASPHDAETESRYKKGTAANRLAIARQSARVRGAEYKQETQTLGWKPACKCDAGVVPSTVLDSFVGSGTTLWVAKKLNRRAIGYEISSEYCDLAIKRNRQQSLGFRNKPTGNSPEVRG